MNEPLISKKAVIDRFFTSYLSIKIIKAPQLRARMLVLAALAAPKARTRENGKDFVHQSGVEGAYAS